MEKFKKDKTKHDDNSRYKDSKLSIFPLIESIKIYISKSYRNFKADDNRSFTQSYFSDAIKLLLDTYPNASAAYSLRKLSSSYQGPAIRVRRSSDNQEQDIYFDSLSNLDTNSLTSFVGSQNLILQSEAFDTLAWVKSNASILANAIESPFGSITADTIKENNNSSAHEIYNGSTNFVSGQKYTFSVYAKQNTGSRNIILYLGTNVYFGIGNRVAMFNLTSGECVYNDATVQTTSTFVGNGWWRFSISANAISTGLAQLGGAIGLANGNLYPTNAAYTGDNTSSFYIFGAQLNSGPIQSYAATTTAIAGDGFVTTWYNQKGSAANLVQTTAANQPSIVVSGVIQTELGKPVILFGGGTTIALNLATPYTFSSSVFSKSIVSKYTGSGFVTVRESAWGSSGTLVAQYYTDHFRHYVAGFASNQYMINDPATPGPSLALHNITHTHTFGGSLDDGIPQLISYYRNANKAAIAFSSNKDQWTTNILFSPTPATNTTAYSYVSAEVIYWDGNLEESMDAIRKNVNQYYSIY